MRTARLLEREELLSRLEEHVSASRHGSGRLVFIGGEAGAGKTSLLRRFTAELPSTTHISWGACEDMTAPTPLGPLLDIADGLVEDAEEFIGLLARRYRLFNSVLATLKASTEPRVLVFEDLHWADQATFDLLRFLSRRVADAPALLLATYRDDELGPDHGLRRLLGDVAAASTVHRLTVPPLSLAAVRELASELNVDPAVVHARTRGNPFFVTEVLAAGGEGLPEKLSDAIAARISRLSPAGRSALELASAFVKHELDADSLSALVPGPEAIDECIDRGLLVGNGRELGFRHELVREAVAAATPLTRRRSAHARILAYLEGLPAGRAPARGARRETVGALAHHAAEASDATATLRYATAAGKLALKYQANREARIQFSRALPLAHALSPEARAQLYQDHAKVCCVTGNYSEIIEPSLTAVSEWLEAGRPAKAAQAMWPLAGAYSFLGQYSESRRVIAEAEALVENATQADSQGGATEWAEPDWEVVLDTRAMIYLDRGEECYPNAREVSVWTARAEESWRDLGSRMALAVAQRLRGVELASAGRYHSAARWMEKSIETAAENDYDDLMATGHVTIGVILQLAHRHRLADRFLEQAMELGRNWDLDYIVTRVLSLQSVSHLFQGRWTEAEATATVLLGSTNPSVASRFRTLITLGLLRARRGDPNATGPLEEALEMSTSLSLSGQVAAAYAAMLEAASLAGAGVDAALLSRAKQAFARLEQSEGGATHTLLAYWLWKAGAVAESPGRATGPYALQMQGRSIAAARRWRRLGCPYEQAVALEECGEVDALRQAHAIFLELGAAPAAARTAASLRRSGVRHVPSRTPAGADSLTPREQQVLTLMRQGLRNAEIAQVNKVSPRTVDHQVSAVLAKLGARSRTEAVALANSLDIA